MRIIPDLFPAFFLCATAPAQNGSSARDADSHLSEVKKAMEMGDLRKIRVLLKRFTVAKAFVGTGAEL